MPFDDMRSLSALNWDAEIVPLYDHEGNELPADIGRGMSRSDTGAIIGICGKNTKPVQHQDVFDPILQTLHDQKYDLVERDYSRRDLADLKGQRGAFVKVEEAANGAIIKLDVITGDFTNPTGPSSYLPDGPPTLFRRYTGLNSHNSTYAAQAAVSYVNLVCMNGLVSPEFTAVTKGKHTKGFNIDAFKGKILSAASMMEGDTARFEQYIKTPCTPEQAEAFIKATLASNGVDEKGNPKVSDTLVKQMLELFQQEANTVWGVYQAMTAWATHGDLRRNATALTARVGRDERVARAMRSPEFQGLLAA